MRVTAVVVHYENEPRTHRCLESLKNQKGVSLPVVLVDHALQAMRGQPPGVEILRPAKNLGFGAGVALGIEAFPVDAVLLLNPDAVAEPTWAAEMIRALDASPSVGMVACRVRAAEPNLLDSAGLGLSRGGLGILRGHGKPLTMTRGALQSVPLLGPTGAAAAYRTRMLEELGGFPSEYFLYYEDLEVAFRGRRRGWQCAWVDTVLVCHHHDSSAGARKSYYLRRAQQLFRKRNWPGPWRRKYCVFSWLATLAAFARASTRGRLRQVIQAHRDAARSPQAVFADPPPSETWLARRP